jgi:hypothetical protein
MDGGLDDGTAMLNIYSCCSSKACKTLSKSSLIVTVDSYSLESKYLVPIEAARS